ncbi:MAG: B12-binding domain-containing radical SAM protein [Bradymonadales bacterium]|nr:B12-binding domain-containing radical SAM protein [Bradymonadales bacterium]
MAGVLLVTAPSPTPTAGPPLGLQYLSASLHRAKVEVTVMDLASPHGPRGSEALRRAIDDQRPEILGITLYTETALTAYRILEELGPRPQMIVAAGGPHATAVPEEALQHGFDLVVRGEGEQTLVELVAALRNKVDLSTVAGLTFRDPDGTIRSTPDRPRIAELDQLASPSTVHELFRRDWYVQPERPGALSASLITSRGCPGRCIFCSNFITGRRYRFHSTERVLQEMQDWQRWEGSATYFFHDDAFATHRARLLALCQGMERLPFRPHWLCETRADQIDVERATAMARAGCTAVIIGIESGDPVVLERIGKGITLDEAESALRVVKEAGLRTQANFMLGFPDETTKQLDNTLGFMQRIAGLVDGFSSMGIVVPYPGTPLYERYHQALGFTRWWLDRWRMDRLNVSWNPEEMTSLDAVFELHRAMEEGVLQAGLVPYTPEVRAAIQRCLEFRRDHNRDRLTRAGQQGSSSLAQEQGTRSLAPSESPPEPLPDSTGCRAASPDQEERASPDGGPFPVTWRDGKP